MTAFLRRLRCRITGHSLVWFITAYRVTAAGKVPVARVDCDRCGTRGVRI